MFHLKVENSKSIPEPIPGDESEHSLTNSTVTPAQSEVPTSAERSIELSQEPIPQPKKKWCSC